MTERPLAHDTAATWMHYATVLEAENATLRARVAALEAMRCDCDEEGGHHDPRCVVMLREVNETMLSRVTALEAE